MSIKEQLVYNIDQVIKQKETLKQKLENSIDLDRTIENYYRNKLTARLVEETIGIGAIIISVSFLVVDHSLKILIFLSVLAGIGLLLFTGFLHRGEENAEYQELMIYFKSND
jgi:hypothetical protein